MRSTLRVDPLDTPHRKAVEDDRLFVAALDRGLRVLSAFHHATGPLSLTEIADRAGIGRSAAQRLVHTLSALGYIRRGPDGRGYLPALRVLDHTLDVLRLDPVVQSATPVLLELRKTVKERVDLSLFDQTRLVYALRMQSKRETFYATLVGHSVPMFCTAGGRAVLSRLPEDHVMRILEQAPRHAYTAETRTGLDQIAAAVQAARTTGFAVVANEFLHGEVAVGVPIVRADGTPLGAIHVAGSLGEWTDDAFVDRMAPLALEAARAVSASL